MSVKQSDQQLDSGSLYKGWLTGWAFEACVNLYFPEKTAYDEHMKGRLLSWLIAYRALAEFWGDDGFDLVSLLGKMTSHVENPGSPTLGVGVPTFDQSFREVRGAARAKGPYIYDVVGLASNASRYFYPRIGDTKGDRLDTLNASLLKAKNSMPASAYEVISCDIARLKRLNSHKPDIGERIEAGVARKLHSPRDFEGGVGADLADEWSELITGSKSAREVLNWSGRGVMYLLLGIIGTLSYAAVGIGFGVVVFFVLSYANVGSTFSLSNIGTSLSVLAAVGISLPGLATKLWGGLKTIENQLAMKLARVVTLRENPYFKKMLP